MLEPSGRTKSCLFWLKRSLFPVSGRLPMVPFDPGGKCSRVLEELKPPKAYLSDDFSKIFRSATEIVGET